MKVSEGARVNLVASIGHTPLAAKPAKILRGVTLSSIASFKIAGKSLSEDNLVTWFHEAGVCGSFVIRRFEGSKYASV